VTGITEPAEVDLVAVLDGFASSEQRAIFPWCDPLKGEPLALGEVQQPLRRPKLRTISTHS
jgi:hypothetical protein